jgi:hypothetical protein
MPVGKLFKRAEYFVPRTSIKGRHMQIRLESITHRRRGGYTVWVHRAKTTTPLKEKACLNSRLERSWWRRRGSNPRPPHCERGALNRSQPLDLSTPLVSRASRPAYASNNLHRFGYTNWVHFQCSCVSHAALGSHSRQAAEKHEVWARTAPQKTNGQARCLAHLIRLSIRFWIMLCLPKKT